MNETEKEAEKKTDETQEMQPVKRSVRVEALAIVGVGAAMIGKADGDVRNGAYPTWVLAADSSLYPANAKRYQEDAKALYAFFLTKVPWETWDEFERLSENRRGGKED